MDNSNIGDRMKFYEMAEAGRMLMPLLPVCVRIDGKCFSKFTKGFARPYDERMSRTMVETTIALVEEYNALVGYTQSDEISLILYTDSNKSQLPFNGRIQKLIGDMAAFASLKFNHLIDANIPEKSGQMARFDCRVWNVPNKTEASNAILWREFDATKNSVSMAAQHHISHSDLQGKHTGEMQDMLHELGVNWNDYPAFFKRGTYVLKKKKMTKFSDEELERLPAKHQARTNPDLTIERSVVEAVDMPVFSKVINRVEVIFDGADPVQEENS
jgi:tRNA(His) 5'-end guanylyltransferase